MRSRYYAPETGRFTTRDTWRGDYTRPLSLNRWNYVEGNPINRTDPTGHCFFGVDTLVCIAIAGALGGVVGGMAYHGYEVLTSEDPCARWDWNRALLWGGVGGTIGTTLAVGGYGVYSIGVSLGWWGTAACADGYCMNEVRALGKLGEKAAGINAPKIRIPSLTGTAKYRIPDELDIINRTLKEVKNVGYLSYTNQLKDFVAYAQEKSYTFTLVIHQTTILSGPLEKLHEQGKIILEYLPW